MAASRLSRRMSAEDAWFLYFEKPHAPLHIGSVAIFEDDIPADDLRASMSARMHLIPRYRQRAIVPALYAAHPAWEDDPDFHIDRHVHEVRLPEPGTEAQLRAAAATIFAPMLPRDRPLWDITVVRGLEGGRTAYVSRVHHCLVDGVSGIELLLAVLDLVPNPEPSKPPDEAWDPRRLPGALEAWAEAMFDQWMQGMRAWTRWQQDALDARAQMRRAAGLARALEIAMPLALRQPHRAPWNKPISGERAVAWTDMSFREVRGIRSALGGTVNDVMLAVLGGALGRELREQGVATEDLTLRVQIPVNVRSEDEKGALGNRVSMMLPEIPVWPMTPEERLRAVREEMERLKADAQASAFEQLLELSENLPAAWHALAGMGGVPQGALNLVCTNVPGPLIPLYSVGRRMLAHYPLVPLAGDLGIGIGITSFDQGLYFAVMCDPRALPDPGRVAGFVANEFRALRAAAGVQQTDLPEIGSVPPHLRANGSASPATQAATPAA